MRWDLLHGHLHVIPTSSIGHAKVTIFEGGDQTTEDTEHTEPRNDAECPDGKWCLEKRGDDDYIMGCKIEEHGKTRISISHHQPGKEHDCHKVEGVHLLKLEIKDGDPKIHVQETADKEEMIIEPRFRLTNLANLVSTILDGTSYKPQGYFTKDLQGDETHQVYESVHQRVKEGIEQNYYPKSEWTQHFDNFKTENEKAMDALQKIVKDIMTEDEVPHNNPHNNGQEHQDELPHNNGQEHQDESLRNVQEPDANLTEEEIFRGQTAGEIIRDYARVLSEQCQHAKGVASLLKIEHGGPGGLKCDILENDETFKGFEDLCDESFAVDQGPDHGDGSGHHSEQHEEDNEFARKTIAGLKKAGIDIKPNENEKAYIALEDSSATITHLEMENAFEPQPSILAMPAPLALLPPWPLPLGQLRRRHPWRPVSYTRQGSRLVTSRRCQLARGFL